MCKLGMYHSSRVTWHRISEIMWKFCYLSDTTETQEGTLDSVAARGRNGLSKFGDLLPLLTTKALLLGLRGRLY